MNAALVFPHPTDMAAVRAWVANHQPDPKAVHRWARPILTAAHRAGSIPLLGTAEWCALPHRDPRKLAALVITALADLHANTPTAIAERLRRELDDYATSIRRMFVNAHNDVSEAARARRDTGYTTGPSHAELVRRRACLHCPTCRTNLPYDASQCATCDWAPHTAEQLRTARRAA